MYEIATSWFFCEGVRTPHSSRESKERERRQERMVGFSSVPEVLRLVMSSAFPLLSCRTQTNTLVVPFFFFSSICTPYTRSTSTYTPLNMVFSSEKSHKGIFGRLSFLLASDSLEPRGDPTGGVFCLHLMAGKVSQFALPLCRQSTLDERRDTRDWSALGFEVCLVSVKLQKQI